MSLIEHKIKIEPNIFKALIKRAKNEGTTTNKIINNILKKEVNTEEDNEAVFERIERLTNGKAKISNKDTYNPNKSNSIKDMMEAPEGFDPVQAVHDASCGKWE